MRAILPKMQKFETFWWKSLDAGDRFFQGLFTAIAAMAGGSGFLRAVLALPAAAPGCCNKFTIQLR